VAPQTVQTIVPIPKYFVLDQNKCTAYSENDFTSCLDYVKHTLNFEWTEEQCRAAARCGGVDAMKSSSRKWLSMRRSHSAFGLH
jgi:hypothetical protein